MRIPTFSRRSESENTEAEGPGGTGTAPATDTSPVRPWREADDTTADLRPAPRAPHDDLPPASRPTDLATPPPPPRSGARPADHGTPSPSGARPADHGTPSPPGARRADPDDTTLVERPPAAAGPKPRASLLATLGLILGVASVLLVLSGPLLGYGIGVAGLALILSLSGIHATGKRHVAGKTDALIGMVLSLGAIVLGVLALTGQLSWLATDMQPAGTLREWLDARFVDRF